MPPRIQLEILHFYLLFFLYYLFSSIKFISPLLSSLLPSPHFPSSPWASCMLDKYFTTELHPQSKDFFCCCCLILVVFKLSCVALGSVIGCAFRDHVGNCWPPTSSTLGGDRILLMGSCSAHSYSAFTTVVVFTLCQLLLR